REDAASSALASGGILNSVSADFVIIDDVVYLTYDVTIYALPVVFAGPGSQDGIITVSNNVLYFHSGGRWSHPATPGTPPSGAVEGEAVVIDDVLYVTLNGIAWSAAVTPTDQIPPMPLEPGTTLVTGSDGAQYEKTIYVDGTVRYKPTYETLP
ncbi:MAG TPA: hypothetical protein VFQ26_04885, partial [Nitrospiraceae bacterium]|nr:hypothetical protein [Nitrospiraceae bacterium]